MQKRSAKIRSQLLSEAKNKFFSSEKVLYRKEALRLNEQGFNVERAFSVDLDHPERESFLYRISWDNPSSMDSFAGNLYKIASIP